jgi:hypothetical protein
VVVGVVVVAAVGWVVLAHHGRHQQTPTTGPPTTTGSPASPGPSAPVVGVDHLQLGAMLTQQTSLDETLPATLLDSAVGYVGVSLGDDGTTDPEPQPGVYDWSSLDARMRQFTPLHARIVLRAFDAPPWMTGSGAAKSAPLPQYDQAYADLVLAALQRYPQIHYCVVWNELKGYRQVPNHWDFQGYTTLYNTVYTTVKARLPGVAVGGPYVPFPPAAPGESPSALTGAWGTISQNSLDGVSYWLQHKVGADFLAVDGRTAMPGVTPAQPAAATELFSTVDDWLRTQTTLPIWWMEWYARSPDLGAPRWNAVSAYALMQLAASGADNAFLWNPEFVPGTTSPATPGIWESGTANDTGLTPVFRVLATRLYGAQVTLSSPARGVELLTDGTAYVAVNTQDRARTITVAGTALPLPSYAIATG